MLLAAVAVGALAAAPAGAAAATKTVYVGPPPSAAKALGKYKSDPTAFFLHRTTIHAGDSLDFRIQGFHDVDIPAKGGKRLPFIVPNGTTGNLKDEAGSPFWFDGLPSFGPNGALFAGTPTATYDGSKRILSGLPLNGPPPLKVTFAKKGSYAFYCDIHPGMKGSVKVVGKKAKAPTKKSDHKALK